MELRALRYFIAVAEERSFTRAADRLWIAQPGLSSQVRRLEGELGIQLFHRHARGVELTPAGETFLERARVVLSAVAEATATGRDLETGATGTLRLGLSSGVRWRGTGRLLDAFAQQRPGVELTILEGLAETLWRGLRQGRFDAIVAPSCCRSVDLDAVDLGSERWALLVGAPHRLAGEGPIEATALSGERIAVTGHRDGTGYDNAVGALLSEFGVSAIPVRTALGPGSHGPIARGTLLALSTVPEAVYPGLSVRPLEPCRTVDFQLLSRCEPASPPLEALISMARASTATAAGPNRRLAAA